MSRIAIISDIHANLTALEGVLQDAEANGVSSYACLGDIVGYGPNPAECVTKLQEMKCACVKGNHDEYVTDSYDLSTFNDQARLALEWTRGKLSKGQKEWLGSLPYTRRLGRNTLVHATLKDPAQWHYVRNRFDASIMMGYQKTPICFYGHTHKPIAYEKIDASANRLDTGLIHLKDGSKYLINVGSVGQSRDGDPKASYVIFDRIARTIEFRRVNYDILHVADEINSNNLPNSLADRLIEAS